MNNSAVAIPPTTSSLSSSNIELPVESNNLDKQENLYSNLIKELEMNRDKNGFEDVDFNTLSKIGDNSDVRELLKTMLVGMYNSNTERLTEVNKEIENLQEELRFSLTEIDESENDIRDFRDKLSTNTRKSEIEINEIRRTEYQIRHMIVILIVLLVALLFPLLKMFGVLNQVVATMIYVLIIVTLAGYSGYFLWYKLINVDPNNFDKVNLSQDKILEKTEDSDRECVPTDEEQSFDTEVTESCVNPAELRVPDYKMDEYLNTKCSTLDEEPRF